MTRDDVARIIKDKFRFITFANGDGEVGWRLKEGNVEEIAEAILAALPAQEWQDISTAPNDRDILGTAEVAPGRWINAQIRAVEGIFWDWNLIMPKPSHWRDLPAPPVAVIAEERGT